MRVNKLTSSQLYQKKIIKHVIYFTCINVNESRYVAYLASDKWH